MTKFVGRLGKFGGRKEASRGGGGVPTFWLPYSTVSFEDRTANAREQEALGRIEDSDANFVTMKMGEGELEFDLEDKAIGLLLTSLMGASPTTSGGPTYTHAYDLENTNQHQSLALFYQDPNLASMFANAVVDRLSLNVAPEGIVKATAGFKSRGSKDWTEQVADYTATGNKFLHQDAHVKIAADIAGLSGASEISVKNLQLTISANTVFDQVIGTAAPEDILNTGFSVEGSLTLNQEDATYRNLMLDGTYKALEIFLNRAANSSLKLQFPRVDFTEWERDRGLDEIVSQSINFKGNYDATNGLAVISTCELVNTYAGTNY